MNPTPRERYARDLTGAIDAAKTLLGSRVIVQRHGHQSADLTIGLSRWRVQCRPAYQRRGPWFLFEVNDFAAGGKTFAGRFKTARKAVGFVACLAIEAAEDVPQAMLERAG